MRNLVHEENKPLSPSEPTTEHGQNADEFANGLTIEGLCADIRAQFLDHLNRLGLVRSDGTQNLPDIAVSKDAIRMHHAAQREQYRLSEARFVFRNGRNLLRHFATGKDVRPGQIDPELCLIDKDDEDAALFRFATLLWSVPVSRGYGRRMRFLVRDRSNGKLIGIFALSDPVFNLRARDEWIGWDASDRKQRLVNVMDANVVGAVPPYAQLLGGKLVASTMASREVSDAFRRKYTGSQGIISGQRKHAELVLITVTSALGRSSLYNRLKLPSTLEFYRIGMTQGWGHFQVPNDLFQKMRDLLQRDGHPYASGHQYGQGPNWRMRVVREALKRSGLNPDLLRHGIAREIYACPLADDWREYLRGERETCAISRPSLQAISSQALARWVLPRAARVPDFVEWTQEDTWRAIVEGLVL